MCSPIFVSRYLPIAAAALRQLAAPIYIHFPVFSSILSPPGIARRNPQATMLS